VRIDERLISKRARATIWCELKARIFEEKEKQPPCLVSEIKEAAMLWSKAGAKHLIKLVGFPGRE
jgi:hypothetical protein